MELLSDYWNIRDEIIYCHLFLVIFTSHEPQNRAPSGKIIWTFVSIFTFIFKEEISAFSKIILNDHIIHSS